MDKPPFSIPSLKEISEIPHNGLNAISTFSGMGGSSLGYKQAGFKVLWANEFIEEAGKTYRANHTDTILDIRDIRKVKAGEILEQIGMKKGELDLFDGSPPCASFSMSGKRSNAWGEEKKYSGVMQRVDDLFFEYARLVKEVQPKVFVAENVQGLVNGVAKGYFKEIIKILKEGGYRVRCALLDSMWLGVPQSRQRVIFVGVRNDIGKDPVHPKPDPYFYTLKDAFYPSIDGECWQLPEGKMKTLWTESHRSGKHLFSACHDKLYGKKSSFNHQRARWDHPCPTIVQGSQSIYHPDIARSLTVPEVKRVSTIPDDFILTGTWHNKWERCGRTVPPACMERIARTIRDEILL